MGPEGGFLGSGQIHIILWGSLAAMTTLLFLTFLIFLCSSCNREKKARHQNGDHENLMNVPSDKEVFSHSITSSATEPPPNSEQNGALSNGEVLSEDSTTACIQPYEEVQTSDLPDQQDSLGKSIKCHQSRELPSIPPNTTMETIISARNAENDQGLGMEGPYEVLKDSSSQENIVEDCLYETVKEIKDVGAVVSMEGNCNSKSKTSLTVSEGQNQIPECRIESAEYASVDRNKKSRQSANSESPLDNIPDVEDELPPPVPMKLLDENENVQEKQVEEEVTEGASKPEKRLSSVSYKSREEDPSLTEDEISAMYSSVSKPGQAIKALDSPYTCIQEIASQRSPSICSGLYASVKDFENTLNSTTVPQSADRPNGELEPDYEAIQSVSQEEDRTVSVPNTNHTALSGENDYESIGDLQHHREFTRL
ncbi:PREDICTED: phosphoprotein associated with glycosphingolipid-enriched microdomains 1 isoform X1 [Lepidothrix coronata]|uniref:Phosphoprotein associated with glycosphingolipid-enriched microdomains 1 isoform X1 n=2 Tax=Lepidothrix coronata TaxID=321398 RepID=A0A6J0IVT3_9PASS|nr:PREDICTED: phosphoprotein associated with glycosphingolipid-enriched microdomains 1 isoform X1 [Lepidothrix coronata]XP_017690070.1 PREDICTED: phosphoprotein associated with glycosphingolipid-enriched microdomains 1 isoform X1 [Lepidothrix coronata]XP_017690071.1 PREDICTED: phosphoprotein associated with glycosphingolipid-enriched microdomains 1 isoform X1 [Lepidothrix coronata]XP_017690072.1 PREDICTED: phosphoprotein associated with glycosphingolipid-enriched microdomains 1 isoform X1 [Lepid